MGGSLSLLGLNSNDKIQSFSLLWLDGNIDRSKENQSNMRNLQEHFNSVKGFSDCDKCEEYIKSISEQNRIILIVSGQLGQQIVPSIHSLEQLLAIYVYCQDLESNERWAAKFDKIKYVVNDWNELMARIIFDHEIHEQNRRNAPLPISIFDPTLNYEKLTIDLQGNFVQLQLLINSVYMRPKPEDKSKLIKYSRRIYKNDPDQMKIIKEFEREYVTERALYWYTQDLFPSRLLNKALRTRDINALFLFHFFVLDIQHQLKTLHNDRPRKAYRNQLMSKDELENLKKALGKFISINSFLSAYADRDQALSFLKNDKSFEKVLFEINADPKYVKDKPYADIRFYNADKEQEVLFMLGSIFEIVDVKHDQNRIWVFQLKLYPDDAQSLDLMSVDTDKPILFGHVLETMGKIEEAKIFYQTVLDKSKNNLNVAHYYEALARIADGKGDYDESLHWYNKALNHNKETQNQQYLDIASNYNNIGEAYRKKRDYEEALTNHEKALEILQKKTTKQSLVKQVVCHNSIGIVYLNQQNYRKALEYYMKALQIRKEQQCPLDEISLGMLSNNIGNAYYYLNYTEDANYHYNEALKYYKKKLPPNHPKLGSTYNNLGALYDDQNRLKDALSYYEEALNIYHGIYSDTHPYVDKIRENIDGVKNKSKK